MSPEQHPGYLVADDRDPSGRDPLDGPAFGSAAHWLTFPFVVGAIGFGALGLGFGAFIYLVPYGRMARDLKRRQSELISDTAELSLQRRELEQIKQDLAQTRGDSNLAESHWRSDFKVIAAAVAEKVSNLDVSVELRPRSLRIRFMEDALFDARGAGFSRAGQGALEAIAEAVHDKAARILITAPMGAAKVPKAWQDAFGTPGELSATRVKNVARVFAKHGIPNGVVWGVTVGGPSGPEGTLPTLDLDIEPRP